jgi:SAM-dependent methyltransferase
VKLSKVTQLPSYIKNLRLDIDRLYKLLEEINYKVVNDNKNHTRDTDTLKRKTAKLADEVESLRFRNTELEHMMTAAKFAAKKSGAPTTSATPAAPAKELFADNHDLDAFYLEFENRFRGTEEEIQRKQRPYIDVFKKAKVDKNLPIADLGCGRGEFLDLLKQNDFNGIGVDLNESMVERAKKQGFKAVNNDAISYLMEQKSNSHAGVTGFHLAEHIPFDQLLLLIAEAYRVLAKGGILLLETPNPESVFVGAFTFHYDPSHLKPLPPDIMRFSALFKGFDRAEIMRMQPELTEAEIKKATDNPTLQGALQRLYGPRDYALVAYK